MHLIGSEDLVMFFLDAIHKQVRLIKNFAVTITLILNCIDGEVTYTSQCSFKITFHVLFLIMQCSLSAFCNDDLRSFPKAVLLEPVDRDGFSFVTKLAYLAGKHLQARS